MHFIESLGNTHVKSTFTTLASKIQNDKWQPVLLKYSIKKEIMVGIMLNNQYLLKVEIDSGKTDGMPPCHIETGHMSGHRAKKTMRISPTSPTNTDLLFARLFCL